MASQNFFSDQKTLIEMGKKQEWMLQFQDFCYGFIHYKYLQIRGECQARVNDCKWSQSIVNVYKIELKGCFFLKYTPPTTSLNIPNQFGLEF